MEGLVTPKLFSDSFKLEEVSSEVSEGKYMELA